MPDKYINIFFLMLFTFLFAYAIIIIVRHFGLWKRCSMESLIYIYILIIFAASVGSKIFGKLCSNIIATSSVSSYALYQIASGSVACIFFFISGGFRLELNLVTVIYSIIFALIVAISIISILAYKVTNVSMVTILSSTTTIIGTSLLGALVFRETVSLRTVLRIAIMLLAVLLTFLDRQGTRGNEKERRSITKGGILILALAMLITLLTNASSTIVTKFYALDTRVVDENSFFFFTNVFLVFFAAVAFAVDSLTNREHFKMACGMLNPKKLLTLSGNTVCSNIVSLIGVPLLALIDVSVYTPIMSAVGIISGVAGSLVFRERLGIYSYLAAAIACITVIL